MAQAAGFKGKLSIVGASTATTGEATTNTTGNTYQITNNAKRVLDYGVARVWKDNGSPIPGANILSEDLLFGKVTLNYTPTHLITVDCSYFPLIPLANVKSAKISYKLATKPTTSLNGTGDQTLMGTIRSLSLTGQLYDDLRTDYDTTTGGEQSLMLACLNRSPKLYEYDPSGDGSRVLRGWMLGTAANDDLDAEGISSGEITWESNDQTTGTAGASFAWGSAA